MNQSNDRLHAAVAALLGILVAKGIAFGQSKTVTLTADGPRPLAKAVLEIEGLSGIPINYEDFRIEHPPDMNDVTDVVQGPAQKAANPNSRIIVPRGGHFSANILVDAVTGKLTHTTDVAHALNAILAAYRSSNLPGDFSLESFNGVFLIAPVRARAATGTTVPFVPIFSTRITLREVQRNAYQTLKLILDQVAKAVDFRIGLGAVPRGTTASQITIGAEDEPASHVIARLMGSLATYGHRASDSSWVPGLSYTLLYDPGLKYYMFNIFNIHSVVKIDVTSPMREVIPRPTPGSRPRTLGPPHRP